MTSGRFVRRIEMRYGKTAAGIVISAGIIMLMLFITRPG